MDTLSASYFDGHSTRVYPVGLTMAGDALLVTGPHINRRVAFSQVKVDERLGSAPRKLRFSDGAFCEVRDLIALDSLLASANHQDGWVDRLQRHTPLAVVAVVVTALLVAAGYRWVLPWAAERAVPHIPVAMSQTLAAQTLRVLDGALLKPSALTAADQESLTAKFHALRQPAGSMQRPPLLFRASPQLGANAFTLPDGSIIVLDDLVTALHDDREVLAVLAHELGHANGHHSLRLLLQSTALGAIWTFYVGDISALLVVAPTAITQARYSREFEEQADDFGASVMALNGMPPGLLADALEKIAKSHPESANVGFLSTHPATRERLRRLRGIPVRSAEDALPQPPSADR